MIDENYKLPCDVRLPPNTIIRKGCKLKILLMALRTREGENLQFSRNTKPEENLYETNR